MKTYRHKTNGSTMTYNDGCMKIDNLVIEGTPNLDYWEEVVEKEYEILSLRAKSTGLVRIKEEDGLFQALGDERRTDTTEEYLLDREWEILSVKRLSDREIFTIGDKITFKGLFGNSSEHKFDIIRGFGNTVDDNLAVIYHNGKVGLHKVEKYRVLFTTEDGVDTFEGDNYFYTNSGGSCVYKEVATVGIIDYERKCNVVRFSTKEKAEEYLLMEKPILSLNDLLSVWGNEEARELYKTSVLFKKFKKLAELKYKNHE